LPHEPQFAAAVCVSTHWVPHFAKPAEQVKSHFPPLQLGTPFVGAPHTVPHEPQFALSLWTLTHEPPQFVVPVGHDVVQALPAQTSFVLQTVSHFPQWSRSL